MGINFPNVPTTNQLYPQPPVAGLPVYRWDGAKWLIQTVATAVAMRNYVINGAMMVSQENGSAFVTPVDGYYPLDQFRIGYGMTGVCSVGQVASLTPAGSPNRLRATVTTAQASVAAGNLCLFDHRLEGRRVADLQFGTATAKQVIIQFGVRAPAGVYSILLLNGSSNRVYVAEYTIAAGEANTDVVKSVIIPGDVIGTWTKDNTLGLMVEWTLACGSTYFQTAGSWTSATSIAGSPNQFNLFGTVGNVFELFDVGLYQGNVAPAFQVPEFASELILCKRYWQKTYDYGTATGTVTMSGTVTARQYTADTYAYAGGVYFSPEMRAQPTVTIYSPNTGAAAKVYNNLAGDVAATQTNAPSTKFTNIQISNTSTSAPSSTYSHVVANARM
jgi:hypothetical protein